MTDGTEPGVAWRVKDGLAEAELDGERVVWDPDTGQLARLDRIGSLVWLCLDGAVTVEELSADLAHAFGMPAAVVRTEVENLLRRLSEVGLVTEGPEATA